MSRSSANLCCSVVSQINGHGDVIEAQRDDPQLQKLVGKVDIALNEEGIIRFQHQVCVSDVAEVRKEVLEEAHKLKFFLHLGSNKMYQDLKKKIWWQGMKKDVADFVTK